MVLTASKISEIDPIDLEKIITSSTSLSEAMTKLGLKDKSSATYRSFKQKLNKEKIDFSHIALGKNHNKGRKFQSNKKISLDKILIENSSYCRGNLKRRLIQEQILKNECSICGQLPEWCGRSLTLQLDHINGVADDNRLKNLRIVCPHCHSQTITFAGRNTKRVVKEKISKIRSNKRPSKEELEKMLWKIPNTKIAKEFKVSGVAVAMWAKYYGLSKPKRGYWAQMKKMEGKL